MARWTVNLLTGVCLAGAFAWVAAPGDGARTPLAGVVLGDVLPGVEDHTGPSAVGATPPEGEAVPRTPETPLIICGDNTLERVAPPFIGLPTHQTVVIAIKSAHALALRAQPIPTGGWRIGYGHRETAERGMEISAVEAERLLRMDLAKSEAHVRASVTVPLHVNEFSALVYLLHTSEMDDFAQTPSLQRLNLGDRSAALGQFQAIPADRWHQWGDVVELRARQQALFACSGRARYVP